MSKIIGLTLLVSLFCLINGHTYRTGECPTVEPMSGFDMKRFIGIWYVIEKTSTSSACVVYNISRADEPGEYNIQQISQQAVLAITPIKHAYSYTGQLSVTDSDVPARMTVKFPLSVAGTSKFTVFMTDYVNSAAIFTCQKIPFGHRQSATILSRTKDMDKPLRDQIRSRLASFEVDPFDLSIVNQTGCPKVTESSWNINIDSDTFSAKSFANAFRKAGEKIGDGLEWTVNASKKLYNKYAGDSDSSDSPNNKDTYKLSRMTIPEDKDAEWLP